MNTVQDIIKNLAAVNRYYSQELKAREVAKARRELENICRNTLTFEFCLQFTQASKRKVEYFQVEGYELAKSLFETYRKMGHAMKLHALTLSTISEIEDGEEYKVNKATFSYNNSIHNS